MDNIYGSNMATSLMNLSLRKFSCLSKVVFPNSKVALRIMKSSSTNYIAGVVNCLQHFLVFDKILIFVGVGRILLNQLNKNVLLNQQMEIYSRENDQGVFPSLWKQLPEYFDTLGVFDKSIVQPSVKASPRTFHFIGKWEEEKSKISYLHMQGGCYERSNKVMFRQWWAPLLACYVSNIEIHHPRQGIHSRQETNLVLWSSFPANSQFTLRGKNASAS